MGDQVSNAASSLAAAGVTIRRATTADSAAICRAHYEALDQFHDFYATFFKKHPREMLPLLTDKGMAQDGQVFYVAEEDGKGGDVVGFVRYSVEEPKAEEEEKKKKEESKEEEEGKKEEKGEQQESPFACKEEMKALWKEFNDEQGKRDEAMENAIVGERYLWVQHLMVRPTHQRRGIGRALLSTALQHAEAAQIPSMIVSSSESVGLYKKMGFVSKGSFVIDNGYWARKAAQVLDSAEGERLVEMCNGMFEVEDVMVRGVNGEKME